MKKLFAVILSACLCTAALADDWSWRIPVTGGTFTRTNTTAADTWRIASMAFELPSAITCTTVVYRVSPYTTARSNIVSTTTNSLFPTNSDFYVSVVTNQSAGGIAFATNDMFSVVTTNQVTTQKYDWYMLDATKRMPIIAIRPDDVLIVTMTELERVLLALDTLK